MFEYWPMSTPPASRMEIAAHELVASGFAIVPMKYRGKVPLTSRGCKDATRSHEQVTTYWQLYPFANIGVATGIHVGLFVIDIDGLEGEASFAAFGAMPATVEALTGKGRHLYFRTPPGLALSSLVGRLGPQLDTRADGGLVVAPPSTHSSGRVYRWADGHSPDEIELSLLPDALVQAVLALQAPTAREGMRPVFSVTNHARTFDRPALEAFRAWFAKVDRFLGPGKRNSTAWRIAVRALSAMPFADAFETLADWNSLNCPPLSSVELRAVIQSAQRTSRRTGSS